MVLETAQLLSTAVRLNVPADQLDERPLYKVAHRYHPCTKWVASNQSRFIWTFQHGCTLAAEYNARFNKSHKSVEVILNAGRFWTFMEPGDLLPFENCTPHKELDVIEAYRKTMIEKWTQDLRTKHTPKFGPLGPPSWAMSKPGTNTNAAERNESLPGI